MTTKLIYSDLGHKLFHFRLCILQPVKNKYKNLEKYYYIKALFRKGWNS